MSPAVWNPAPGSCMEEERLPPGKLPAPKLPTSSELWPPLFQKMSVQCCVRVHHIDAEDGGRWRYTPAKTKAIAFWERAKFIPKQRRIPAFSATVSPPLRPGSGNVHVGFTQLRCAGLSLRRWFCTSHTYHGQVSAGLSSSRLPPRSRGPCNAKSCTSCNSQFGRKIP